MGRKSRQYASEYSDVEMNEDTRVYVGEAQQKRRSTRRRTSKRTGTYGKMVQKIRKSLPYVAVFSALVYAGMAAKYPNMISQIQQGTIPFARDFQRASGYTSPMSHRESHRLVTSGNRIPTESTFIPEDTIIRPRSAIDDTDSGLGLQSVSRGPQGHVANVGQRSIGASAAYPNVPHLSAVSMPASVAKPVSGGPDTENHLGVSMPASVAEPASGGPAAAHHSAVSMPAPVKEPASGGADTAKAVKQSEITTEKAKRLKVTDIDQLDPEEGGENPVIRLPGREKALSGPDRESLEREREGRNDEKAEQTGGAEKKEAQGDVASIAADQSAESGLASEPKHVQSSSENSEMEKRNDQDVSSGAMSQASEMSEGASALMKITEKSISDEGVRNTENTEATGTSGDRESDSQGGGVATADTATGEASSEWSTRLEGSE